MNGERRLYFGKYRGTVRDNQDPRCLGRIKVSIPAVYSDLVSDWTLPCLPLAGKGAGVVAIPPVGASVWIEFEGGDPDLPIWSGCFYAIESELPAAERARPEQKLLLRTVGGNQLLLDDSAGQPAFAVATAAGDKVELGPQGISIQTAGGHKLSLGAQGIVLETAGGQKLALTPATVELSNGQGASIKLSGPAVNVNNGGLEVV
jgi:uncharacterized protein involved in type VI secretion and phage assembly